MKLRIGIGCQLMGNCKRDRTVTFRCDTQRVDPLSRPPHTLIAVRVEFPMVRGAERDGKLIRDLAPQRSRLGELQVVRVRSVPPADQAGFGGDEGEVA